MFQHEQIFTRTAIAKQSVEACGNIFYEKDLFNPSKENKERRETFFWTKDQRELIEGDPKRVLFTSNYGTGKTLVMRAKAMNLAKKRHRFFVSKKKEADQGNQIGLLNFFKHIKPGSKEPSKNKTTSPGLIDPGKTFIILFTKPDALLFGSIRQEFEELKDHVQVVCFQG
jgi:hypothetical protein